MNNMQTIALCTNLMKADSEESVINLLKEAGYWDAPSAWRYFGDNENNYSTVGNQQSRPDAALVEKLVNSVDHRLINECLVRGIDPEGSSAPKSIRDAVAAFFDANHTNSMMAGRLKNWSSEKRTTVARGITLIATGEQARVSERQPCFTIADSGEGQTPDMMPNTLLSLNKSNKLRIPFVQGKFNMGGTGVLKFCGRHNLQLIVTRRNPLLVESTNPDDAMWGFTVVRREDPTGTRRSSVFTYLAPHGAAQQPNMGGVLRFTANVMPIFPDGRDPYKREAEWGTLVKLYEYTATGWRGHILRKDGLLSRMDLLLPDVALPIRLHECRAGYRGHDGSFENTLTGINVRLEDNKNENIESGFPTFSQINAMDETMKLTIYAFKKGSADAYRKNEGIIFTMNGQTHGHFTPDFFRRKQVGLSYLADSLLIVVDCSELSGRAREDLFMNSRDRLSHGDLKAQIEDELEDLLKHHQGLRDLKEQRRREELENQLTEAKPLEDILETLLRNSPTLSSLFLNGTRLSNPFRTTSVKPNETAFEGKTFPTFFKFKGKDYGKVLHRECHINMRCRIPFETDAVDDYFQRDDEHGVFSLFILAGGHRCPVSNMSVNLQNGVANLSIQLPPNCRVNDELRFVAIVTDTTRHDPFENEFIVKVKDVAPISGGSGPRQRPPSSESGEGREVPVGIQLPRIIRVYQEPEGGRKVWSDLTPPFDKHSALRIINAGLSDNGTDDHATADVYDFYVNMDNLYLQAELKARSSEAEVLRARFMYGLVLIGLGLIHQEVQLRALERPEGTDQDENQLNIEELVEYTSKAVSPILLPMVSSLGLLDAEAMASMDGSGEAT